MTPNTQLSPALDERLDALPARPVELYLAAGRSAARRRRHRRGGVALGLAAVLACAATWALPLATGPLDAPEQRAAAGPAAVEVPVAVAPAGPTTSLSSLAVEPGLGGIEAFSTEEVPAWAEEYGNHGPVTIAPDGRLWVAPEATVLRTIESPFAALDDDSRDTVTYAVETRWDVDHDVVDDRGVAWSLLYREPGMTGTTGTMGTPGSWTADFALWAEDATLGTLGRPGFAEGLVTFAGARSDRLEAGDGVDVVRQASGVVGAEGEPVGRRTAAELRVGGTTWFVLGTDAEGGQAYYDAYDPAAAGATDLDGFLAFVRAGFVRQDDVS